MKFTIFDSCPPFVWRVKFAIWLIVLSAFIVSGCRRVQKREILTTEPNIEPLVFTADYASGAIQATGGTHVWMKTKKLELDCVVTFYQADDSLYLTEHHFEVYPWLNSIKISAQEPLRRFVWQLSQGRFNVLEGDEKYDVSPKIISYRDYAEAVLNLVAAPVRFLDELVGFIKEPGPVKMEGRWYYPIAQTYPAQKASGLASEQIDVTPVEPYWSKVVFFQDRDSSLVDMVWFAKVDEGPRSAGTQNKFLAVRGYDYKEAEKNGVLVPTKIEIFRTDARLAKAERLVKIDFK